jgi:DNA-binding NtrC family response regulator
MPESKAIRFLIVDHQPEIRELCASIGHSLGLHCVQAATAEEALQRKESDPPEMVLADLFQGKTSGLEMLAQIKGRWPGAEVAMMSACGSIESAVEAMRLGAHDYILKPFPPEKGRLILQGMADKVREARKQHTKSEISSRATSAMPLPCTDLEELERLTVQRVFELVHGDKLQAQKMLGISRATLYRKIKRYGIETRRNGQNVPQKVVLGAPERMILLSQR